ncbi:MAG: Rieske (2Fe-2S) protein [Gammaproteobacteria bacterium]|nr:Rieske (2Fe-2S) protein [Gammaproteobacteria bacterium]
MITLLSIEDLEEGASCGIEHGNVYLFAVKQDGEIYLYFNRCPHLGTPLEWEENRFLDDDGALIRCATHGALFQIEDGRCLVGPCKGKFLKPVPHIVQDGSLMIMPEVLKSPALP